MNSCHHAVGVRRFVLLALLSWMFGAGGSGAHQMPGGELPPGEGEGIESPLAGAEDFARDILRHLRGQGTEEAQRLLDALERHLQRARELRRFPELGEPGDADLERWRAEQALLAWAARHPGFVELDYTEPRRPAEPGPPVILDGQFDLLLFKVITGDGPTVFQSQPWNLTRERTARPKAVEVARRGTTWILLRLEDVPTDRSIVHLAFRETGQAEPGFWHSLTLVAPAHGRLVVDIRDEQGIATPALVRIASEEGNRLREPPGALDLRRQLNDVVPQDIFEPGLGYTFFLPGRLRGRYWIVPGQPFDLQLPEGPWEIHVLHGIEHEPIRETVTIVAGETTMRSYTLRRWVNMAEQGWYAGDDHVHARLMDSADADRLMTYTRAVDLNVANILEMGDERRTYYAQRGFGPAYRVQYGDHWLVPGQEDPRSVLGHAIGLNLPHKVRDLERYLYNDWVAEEIHRAGGLYGHTHVGAFACFVEREMALFQPLEIVDFNSIMQAALGTELFYDWLNLGYRMTASAGSDTPYGGTVGAVRTYAFTGTDAPFSPDAWFDAVRRGRTFVTSGPLLDFRVEDAYPGDRLTFDHNRTVRIKARAWGRPGASAPAWLRVVRFSDTLAEATASPDTGAELELELDLPVGFGGWVAAVTRGIDGSQAHTTPVYLERTGFRHWDVTRVAGLIAKQEAVLKDIEAELVRAEQAVASGANPLDTWSRTNAAHADGVRERIARARALYDTLRTTLEHEMSNRDK